MKDFDVILVGTGSGMNIVSAMMERDPDLRVAVIDKDDPGGICLTRGCIPSKLLLYPAEVARTVREAGQFGIEAPLKAVHFEQVMERMRKLIGRDIEQIRHGLSHAPNLTYYHAAAEFVGPYTMRVGSETVKAPMIFLCTGSRPLVPAIKGLDRAGYHTSDTVLGLKKLPAAVGIIGGGYIAAEYGHFFASMGSCVTILGRQPQFLPREDPEIADLARSEMSKHMTILTNTQVVEVEHSLLGGKTIIGVDRTTGEKFQVPVDELLVATGRASNADLLHPERSGILVDQHGWIGTDEHLETAAPGIWAFGDALGRHMFKHVANYESVVVYKNAVKKRSVAVDYRAVPHAVFTHPEIASVGMREGEAVQAHGKDRLLLGRARFEDTAKGEAMAARGLVKVVAGMEEENILGAHIVGPQASVLIQEIVTLMYAGGSASAIKDGMHIHPALSEVVERAVASLMPVDQYYHMLSHERGEHHHDH
ncbi:MAG: dihydrolipoyl dehydrogenase [Euryarchaeota archaeon]|nr:dihydrolipoyl dehydrogenase [Euryarchaeota archaeon]